MNKLLIDAGTTWSKVLELFEDDSDIQNSFLNENKEISEFRDKNGNLLKGKISLFPSKQLQKLNILFDNATGHMVKNHIKTDGIYENEVIALAYGAKKILNNPQDATIVDLGSRDVKWIKFKGGKYCDLDWNGNCGSATGATVEMLCKFYDINPVHIETHNEKIPVTCGVFAMEKIMDLIASDTPAETAISKYIHGIAYSTWKFAGQPDKIYLSGGFCMNPCFIKSLEIYCNVIPLGRYVLLEGLY
ncbi:MAG: BadF/BadG/BcrA/BcrD ATPase family protein [Candidatus Gastranaerophilales bacterium]|nr:BadF/BadG/BcrA/BcrD ATPase family protein [Candidatus Gastranaerophilales bacterium]